MSMTIILVVFATAGLTLLFGAFASRSQIGTRPWRIQAALAFGFFPIVFAGTAINSTLHNMKEVEFCGSCHTMDYHVKSLTYEDDEPLSSVHYRNNYVRQETACYNCHASYAMFGGVQAKITGLRHVWVFLTDPDKSHEDIKLYHPYANDNCLYCHETSERFQAVGKHQEQENFMERVASGDLSCLKSGCHDEGHYWESEDAGDDDDW